MAIRNEHRHKDMKNGLFLLAALALLSPALSDSAWAGSYPVQFRGVCQSCGRDLLAYYQPVQCLDGRVEWQWVRETHRHCRLAHLGRKKYDFFNSHLMNPANPKRKKPVRYAKASRTGCCD